MVVVFGLQTQNETPKRTEMTMVEWRENLDFELRMSFLRVSQSWIIKTRTTRTSMTDSQKWLFSLVCFMCAVLVDYVSSIAYLLHDLLSDAIEQFVGTNSIE